MCNAYPGREKQLAISSRSDSTRYLPTIRVKQVTHLLEAASSYIKGVNNIYLAKLQKGLEIICQMPSAMFDTVFFPQYRQLVSCSNSTILLSRTVQCKVDYANTTGAKKRNKAIQLLYMSVSVSYAH